jgi:hypothetical protein
MDKRPQRLAKNKTDLMPKNASCKRWDTPDLPHQLSEVSEPGCHASPLPTTQAETQNARVGVSPLH